ncbi:MAG: MBL fold metallo-hydrolase [Pseudomonadota bacterium]
MLSFLSLGSGSKGNATLVRGGDTLLLVDCGFSLRDIDARMRSVGLAVSDLSGVLISHEHGDHVRGLGPLLRKHTLPVWMTHGTRRALRDDRFEGVTEISPHVGFRVGDLAIEPCPIPHDASEPCQYRFEYAGRRFAVMTDIGHVTPHVLQCAATCDALILEANHDPDMLRHGPYPWRLQERIRGGYGHLSNQAGATLLRSLDIRRLQVTALGHLSEQNNTPECALQTVGDVTSACDTVLTALAQGRPSAWHEIA